MELSLGETETLVVRAARGFGLSWGLAQEAGRAALQLATFGFPAIEIFADLFRQSADLSYQNRCPVIDGRHWTSCGPALCPVVLGSAMSDRRELLLAGAGRLVVTGPVYCPLIVVAMLTQWPVVAGQTVSLTWSGANIWFAENELICLPPGLPRTHRRVNGLVLSLEQRSSLPAADYPSRKSGQSRSVTNRAPYDELLMLAQRTYVPAASGAGEQIQAD